MYVTDVEQMFYRFRVSTKHRDFLRFFWYSENNPDKDLTEYRMCVHVFGNSASPAVATYGLRKAVQTADEDVKQFVQRDFYVDDALTSRPTSREAIELLKKTQTALKKGGNIRLHKVASNDLQVLGAFPPEDLGGELKSLDFGTDVLPTQRSLGLVWDLKKDHFVFSVQLGEKPVTRRGVLSMINSIYDPLGFIAPITITGKILLREAISSGLDWDVPLSTDHVTKWQEWRESVEKLQTISIPRMFTQFSYSLATGVSVSIYSDASEKAIASVSYLNLTDSEGCVHSGFLLGKAKLAPMKGHSIPRLELCAAVLSTEIAEIVSVQLDIPLSEMIFYTDSKVVLGYIYNKTRRFYTYVSNRVERILNVTRTEQWRYVSTNKNPADLATRCSSVSLDSVWIKDVS
ncbi:uncharacterized protein LOC132750565 [Ruditapes philippinarum]|uniref:uncharacterized protein LOC132750565 n=1 Tax=Ruditapes philippinarum TaxID=129788 RepID=UPI00295BD022|nr:uncharacterized protein LOC132750565 [Ruditapes philippinarum]